MIWSYWQAAAFRPSGALWVADYRRVLAEMRLVDGTLFPIPITLAIEPRPDLQLDAEIALVDQRNELLAVMRIEEIHEWDLEEEAQLGQFCFKRPITVLGIM